jgi:hypothetical protein
VEAPRLAFAFHKRDDSHLAGAALTVRGALALVFVLLLAADISFVRFNDLVLAA